MLDDPKAQVKTSKGQPLESELVPDTLGDRVIPTSKVPRRPNKPLSLDRIYPKNSLGEKPAVPDTDLVKNYLYAGGLLAKMAF